jgi:hypothetical protein
MILRNATKDPKELNAKVDSGGYLSVTFGPGEEKEVPDNVVKIFKQNPVCAYWFRNKIIVEVKAPKVAVKKAEVLRIQKRNSQKGRKIKRKILSIQI